MLELVQEWLLTQGLGQDSSRWLSRLILFLAVLAVSGLADIIARRFLVSGLTYIISLSKNKWDDAVVRRGVLNRLAHIAPAIVIYVLAPHALEGLETTVGIIRDATLVYMVVMVLLVLDALLNVLEDLYRTTSMASEIPIRGFVQLVKLLLYFLTFIIVISILLNKTPLYLLSGLGAMTAVLMLIFRDAILGFVAGIQLTANRMVAPGDWIEMPKYGADGDVVELTLTTVKIRNWDKTITTIPTYALISESFKNWRGMQESGGRRIKRSINIDMNSIRFCDEEMLHRYAKIRYISEYIESKKRQLEEFNTAERIDNSSLANGRRMTNIGTFRAYVVAYLKNHPMINQEMTFLVRQLPPGEFGLPIEIYVFCKDKEWANYEAIQADIFDHVLAVIPEFDLRVYQNPTGMDFRGLGRTLPGSAEGS